MEHYRFVDHREPAAQPTSRDALYAEIADEHGRALARLSCAYEGDPEKRRDLLQEINLELWRSLGSFEGRCSLRTWVYRVAHNVGTAHVIRQKELRMSLVSLEELEEVSDSRSEGRSPDEGQAIQKLWSLLQRLKPLDRQIIVSWLEGIDAASTGEITGLSPANVAMKVHRIKKILKRWFREGESHGE